jgi:microcystin-dependent protein
MTSFIRKYLQLETSKDIVGDIKYSARTDDHVGWLRCDGRSLDTTTYSSLFAVIGYSFGGSGNSFNLPDPAGRVLGVVGSGSGLTTRSVGDLSGSETHVLSEEELAEHSHVINTAGSHTHPISTTDHSHSYTISANGDSNSLFPGGNPSADSANDVNDANTSFSVTGVTIDDGGEHTHTAQTTGADGRFSIIQPTMFITNTFIYSGLRYIGSRPHIGQSYH